MKNHIDSNFAIAILALVAACVGFSFWLLSESNGIEASYEGNAVSINAESGMANVGQVSGEQNELAPDIDRVDLDSDEEMGLGVVNSDLKEMEYILSEESLWEIPLPSNELRSKNIPSERYMIYAIKKNFTTTVYKKNLATGRDEQVILFKEKTKADNGGNLWAGLPPNVALSEGDKLAYVDKGGLKIHDLRSGISRVLIERVDTGDDQVGLVSEWSIDFSTGKGTYGIYQPKWSHDERYVSFLQAHSEGASFGIVELDSGKFYKPNPREMRGGYNNIVWSPAVSSYVNAGGGTYEGYGLRASIDENLVDVSTISTKFGKGDAPFGDVSFSLDGESVAFVFEDGFNSKNLGMASSDGSNYEHILQDVNVHIPFYSQDKKYLYFFYESNDDFFLMKYSFDLKIFKGVLKMPDGYYPRQSSVSWTSDGYLSFVAPKSDVPLAYEKVDPVIFMLDIINEDVIYMSKPFDGFVALGGFVE